MKKKEKGSLPVHVAIIMDGNGRWARERGLSRIRGHRAGVESIRSVVRASGELGIRYLTLYAFSIENWKRPKREVNALMRLLKRFLRKEVPDLKKNNVRLRTIGRISGLPEDVREEIRWAEAETLTSTGLTLVLALNYGGRSEILDGIRRLLADVQEGRGGAEEVTEETFRRYLYAPDIPDPDLLIRTSGEMRVSNFLLWEISYAELWVTPVYWPDFRREHFEKALRDFAGRQRRFGRVR